MCTITFHIHQGMTCTGVRYNEGARISGGSRWRHSHFPLISPKIPVGIDIVNYFRFKRATVPVLTSDKEEKHITYLLHSIL